jgi:aminopeptidase-like protein
MGRPVRHADPDHHGAGVSLDRSSLPSAAEAGLEMHELMSDLFPLCRSLTGVGVRQTFDRIGRDVPLERTEVASGTRVYDWTLPREWNIRAATLTEPGGEVIADFSDSNLHVLNYSVPVRGTFSLDQLRPHLFTDPKRPEVIPYRTSYHDENWGFCLPHARYERLAEGDYEVEIDSTLEDGHVVYAERFLPGESEDEVLISTYVCHPSLANDNLSGIALAATLARHLAGQRLRRSHRFLFAPATIGPLTWLSRNERRLSRVTAGLVATCIGDPGPFTYKRSRQGNAEVDRAVEAVLAGAGAIEEFSPLGTDERQFGSPGFDLPIGVLSRTPPDRFPEYHSSADDLDFVRPEALGESFHRYLDVIEVLERNRAYRNLSPKGEPQLGKRKLYRAVGGGSFTEGPLLWVLNLSDGRHDLLAVAERSGLPFAEVADAADALVEVGLLAPA